MSIREAQVGDIPRMSEIRLAVKENVLSTPGLVTYGSYVEYLKRRGKGWVAEADGRLEGFAIVDLQGHNIWALFVHPEFEGRGIGHALHEVMLNWYFGKTSETVWLGTAQGTRAEAFYRKAGWREVGVNENAELRFEMDKGNWESLTNIKRNRYYSTHLYKEHVPSGLGIFELKIDSTNDLINCEKQDYLTVITSLGHQIIIKHVEAPVDWLPSGMSVDMAEAWLIYITKTNTVSEQLILSFCLTKNSESIQTEPDTGQHLVAVEFEDGIRQVHIGTQDEEVFHGYTKSAWVPKRFAAAFATEAFLITSIVTNGLISQIPNLLEDEQFYLHYVLAESPRRKSAEYPGEWDVSTWYVVDQTKEVLEKAWRLQNSIN